MDVRPGHLWLLAMPLVGCVDSNELHILDDTGSIELSYRCSELQFRGLAAAEQALVSRAAGKILRFESQRGLGDRASEVQAALRANDVSAVERAVVQYGCTYGLPPMAPQFPEPGSIPPDFALKPRTERATGPAEITLAEHGGQPVILTFWATWCPPCTAGYSELQGLARAARSEGVAVYAILHKDREANLRRWEEENGSGVEFVLDPGGRTAAAYGVRGIPSTFVIGEDGRVRLGGSGYGGAPNLMALLRAATAPASDQP